MRYLVAVALFIALLTYKSYAVTPLAANGQLHVDQTTGKLTNQHGTAIQLRGMSSHGLQWYRDMINPTALKALQEHWGADVVRLSTYIQEGGYENNPTFYRNLVDSLVNEVTAAGMYVIIDFHQLYPGDPWFNINHAVEFFTHMASTHSSKNNVFYEIANEPNSYTNGGSTYLGYDVDWPTIKSYADSLVPIIRRYDDHNIILVGTPTWDQEPQAVIGKEVNDPNVMYTVHFYAATHGSWTMNNVQTAINNNIPVFVTECGTQDASGDGPNDFGSSSTWFDFLDQNGISWVNWNFSPDPRSGAVFSTSPSNYTDYNYYTSDSNLKEAGLWIKARMQTADDWGTPAVLSEKRTELYNGQVTQSETVVDTSYDSNKDTLVHTVTTEYTKDSIVIQIDSLSDDVVFKTLYDTTVTAVSSNVIEDKTDRLVYVATYGLTVTTLVHENIKDTVTTKDSTEIGLDTVVHTISTLYSTDSLVYQYDSTYDEESFKTWYDTSVMHDTVVLLDRMDTLWHVADTSYQFDSTGTMGRDTITYSDTLWGKGKRPHVYRVITEENVNDSLIIVKTTLIDGVEKRRDTTISIVAETRLLSVISNTVDSRSGDTLSAIDTLHNQTLDVREEETGRYTNWMGDTIVSGNIWQLILDSLTIITNIENSVELNPADTMRIVISDSTLLRQYSDTLKAEITGVVTTELDTFLTTTTFDTTSVRDSVVNSTSDTVITTTVRERQTDSLFIQIDTLIDGNFSGKSSFDTVVVLDTRMISQNVEIREFQDEVAVVESNAKALGKNEVYITNNPWIPGAMNRPEIILNLEGVGGHVAVELLLFDPVGNRLYSEQREGWFETGVPLLFILPIDSIIAPGESALAIISVTKPDGKTYRTKRMVGVKK